MKLNQSISRSVNQSARQRRGFTLVELLVTLAIISILAAMGLASYRSTQKRARDARRKADVESIRSSLELYRADQRLYPLTAQVVSALIAYLDPFPVDPSTEDSLALGYTSADGTSYSLCVTLEADESSYCGGPGGVGVTPAGVPTSTPPPGATATPTSPPGATATPTSPPAPTATPTPAAPNQIVNGSFESDLSNWRLGAIGSAAATVARDTSTAGVGSASARVDITSVNPTPWLGEVQFVQDNISLVAGQSYTISFWARASMNRPIGVATRMTGSPWTDYNIMTQDITTSWQQYSLNFVASTTDTSATIQFSLGEQVSTVWLDGVELRP